MAHVRKMRLGFSLAFTVTVEALQTNKYLKELMASTQSTP